MPRMMGSSRLDMTSRAFLVILSLAILSAIFYAMGGWRQLLIFLGLSLVVLGIKAAIAFRASMMGRFAMNTDEQKPEKQEAPPPDGAPGTEKAPGTRPEPDSSDRERERRDPGKQRAE